MGFQVVAFGLGWYAVVMGSPMPDDKKPKRGRPCKPAAERRTYHVRASLNERERDMIREAARLYDMSLSEFVRSCAMATAHHVAPEIEGIERAVIELAASRQPGEA